MAKRKSSFSMMIRNLFGPKEPIDIRVEEQSRGPILSMAIRFFTNFWAMLGLVVFLVFFLFCFIYPVFRPMDEAAQDVTQQNMPPSYGMMDVPQELLHNAANIDAGSGYGIGVDTEGKLYQWGNLSERLKKGPENTGKLVTVSAGLDHALALDEDGKIYTWGNNRLGLGSVPPEVQKLTNIKQIEAGYQYSMVVTEDGGLYFWGNQNLMNVSIGSFNGITEKVSGNTSTAFVVTRDKEVRALTTIDSPITRIPEEVQGRAVDVAATDTTIAALLDDGTAVVWGQQDAPSLEVPEEIQGRMTSIYAGRAHFSALLDDGTMASWGDNGYGQSEAPGDADIVALTAGYHQNYAIDAEHNVHAWGLQGYLMGTDHLGRDMFSRLVAGGRMTMTIGAIAVIISSIIGVIVGGLAGYFGGRVDNILMRFAEIVNAIPFLPLAIILSSVIGGRISETARIAMIMVVLGVLTWPGLARIVRAQVLAEREKEFVTAAQAMGIRESAIVFRHILPNVLTVILVNLTLNFATCMITEATLSWLGFGVTEPSPSWGNMLESAQSSTVVSEYWWRWVFPAAALGLCSISINLMGDGLREAVDPKSQER